MKYKRENDPIRFGPFERDRTNHWCNTIVMNSFVGKKKTEMNK
jgi:hypothetical protein